MITILGSLSSSVNKVVEKLIGIMGISMASVVVLQVFCRYGLNHSLFWSEELARILLIWLTFLGATSAYFRKAHPTVDMFAARLQGRIKAINSTAVFLLSSLFFTVMIYFGVQFAYFARLQISPALFIPKWIIYSAVPLSGFILLVHSCFFFLTDLQKMNDNDH